MGLPDVKFRDGWPVHRGGDTWQQRTSRSGDELIMHAPLGMPGQPDTFCVGV